jgi:hypothetical protein
MSMFGGNIMSQGPLPMPGASFEGMPQLPQIKAKRGFGDPGGLGEKLGTLGAYILAMGGNPLGGALINQAGRREDRQADQQEYQRRLADQFSLWERQQEYKRANPEPINNDTVADFEYIRQQLGEEAARSYLRNKTLPPMIGVDIASPDGGVRREFYPRGSLPGSAAPEADGFDELPPGFKVDGGASPGGSRPFP